MNVKYASSNHAVANDNGDEGTSGGSDHGDDGPGADNADETNAEAQAAPERTMAALTEEWPDMYERPVRGAQNIEAGQKDNAKVAYSKGSKNLSLTGWADGYAGWLGSQDEADG